MIIVMKGVIPTFFSQAIQGEAWWANKRTKQAQAVVYGRDGNRHAAASYKGEDLGFRVLVIESRKNK